MRDIYEQIERCLGDAEAAMAAGDEDAWVAAMTGIRDAAWEGKALVLDKRWADRPRRPLATKSPALPVSTLEDMLS